jgi:hypothetical protein
MSISTAIARCEPIVTKTFPPYRLEANCGDEIYAGHVAEHVDDVKASFGRWFEVLKPRGPHHHNSAGLSRRKSDLVGTKTSSALRWQLALEGYKPKRS